MVFKKDDSVCLSHMTAISTSLTPHVSSGKLCTRVAKIWLTGPPRQWSHCQNQNGGLFYRALDFALTKAGKDSFSVEAGAKKKSLKL